MSNKYFNVISFRSHVHNLNNEIIEITPEALTTLQYPLGQKLKKCLLDHFETQRTQKKNLINFLKFQKKNPLCHVRLRFLKKYFLNRKKKLLNKLLCQTFQHISIFEKNWRHFLEFCPSAHWGKLGQKELWNRILIVFSIFCATIWGFMRRFFLLFCLVHDKLLILSW